MTTETGTPAIDHDEVPQAWRELIEALLIMAKARVNDISPFQCSHDQLTVCADPGKLSAEEIARLDEIGFHAGETEEDGFYSYHYGSA